HPPVRSTSGDRDRLRSLVVRAAGESYIQCFHRDVSERKRASEERVRLAASNARLEQERLAREELAAFIVHDLKNPLSGVVLNARFLARDPALDGDARTAAQHVLTAAQLINRMVTDLLDIARSEDGGLVPRPADMDLPVLLEEVAASTRARCGDANIGVEVRTKSLSAPTIRADVDLLRRVIENLADNAMRYSPRKGTIVIEAISGDGDGTVEIAVSDQGQGIPEADRERVFEKYVQLAHRGDAHGPQLRTGRGLGLLFSRVAVEAHGGKIWVEDAPRGGARFRLTLPADEAALPAV
ncbi:MAG: HAMP domain-containing sensor histidine kinase, partial [Deltaproteobacteria bacterium]